MRSILVWKIFKQNFKFERNYSGGLVMLSVSPPPAFHRSTSRYDDFAAKLNEPKKVLNLRFNYFRSREFGFNLFGSPHVQKVWNELQIDLIELQIDEFLQQKFRGKSLRHFYRILPEENCPKLVFYVRR